MTSIAQIDRGLAQSLNQLVCRTPFLSSLARVAADSLIGIFPVIVSRWWQEGSDYTRDAAVSAVLAGVASLSFNNLLGEILYVRRPYLSMGTRPLVAVPLSSSFPSEHTTAAFSFAATALFYCLPGRFLLLGGAGLIALGRVCVGVHYPSDVLAGAAIGTLWAYVVQQTVSRGGMSELHTLMDC